MFPPVRREHVCMFMIVTLAEHVRRCHNKARDYESRDKGNIYFLINYKIIVKNHQNRREYNQITILRTQFYNLFITFVK